MSPSEPAAAATAPVTFRAAPARALEGEIRVPGDKSMSHRSIMFGAIAHGTSEVRGFLEGEDSLHTLEAFRRMGVEIERGGPGEVTLRGQGPEALVAPPAAIDLGNSGTAMRLMAGLLAGIGLPATLVGDASLTGRPMRRVTEPLGRMGARIDTSEGGTPPLAIAGGRALEGIDYECPVASAQVKSCLLLAGLHARGRTTVREPGVTRDHTERMLRGFGVALDVDGRRASIEGGQTLRAASVTVPGDISSAAFFLVGAAMTPGSRLVLREVGINPTRTGVIEILRLMGASIEVRDARESGGEPVADLHVEGRELRGIDVPEALVSLAIDEFPALFVAACAARGETRVSGAAELRVKETDRIAVMVEGLRALGADLEDRPDGALVRGGRPLAGGTADSRGDHRTAMSFAMASLLAEGPIEVLDCANVDTSFPDFVERARDAGLAVERVTAPGAAPEGGGANARPSSSASTDGGRSDRGSPDVGAGGTRPIGAGAPASPSNDASNVSPR